MLVFLRLLVPRLGPDNQVIQTVTVNAADYRIAGFLLEKSHPGPFRRVSKIIFSAEGHARRWLRNRRPHPHRDPRFPNPRTFHVFQIR